MDQVNKIKLNQPTRKWQVREKVDNKQFKKMF